ncbi:MAG: hypothetical protein RLZZ328_1391 [Bacteroidota bacterium]|jgi:hypothetical protein
MNNDDKKIFISIVAYKDDADEIEETINNLVKNAHRPGRLRFALCLQTNKKYDFSHIDANIVGIVYFKEDEPFGVSRARSILKDMCVDENYFLQIDSHSDCTKNWDYLCIEDYENLVKESENKKIVLSCKHFMSHDIYNQKFNYIYRDNDRNNPLLYHNLRYIFGVPTVDNGPFYENFKEFFDKNKINHLVKTQFLSAHFVFSGRPFIENFRMSHYILFYGEEPEFSLRLFCEGWDIYNYYDRAIIVHDSSRSMHNNKFKELQHENAYPIIQSYSNEKEVALLFREGKNKFVDVNNCERTLEDFYNYHQVLPHRRAYNLSIDYTDDWVHNKFKDLPGHGPYTAEEFENEIKQTNKLV